MIMSTKSNVLTGLESCRGNFISGAELAERSGVSRNAVWKAVNELRSEGYPIESVNNKGYRLGEDSNIISEEGIRLYLNIEKNKKLEPVTIIVYKELDSTNTEAKKQLVFHEDSFCHGTVIAAERQLAGRGHDGSSFDSPEGGIYLSIILEPSKMKQGKQSVAEYIAGCVKSTLEESLDIKLSVKNKSRIYQGKKKICGILTEGIVDMETGKASNYIAGIGILLEDIKTDNAITRNELIARLVESIL